MVKAAEKSQSTGQRGKSSAPPVDLDISMMPQGGKRSVNSSIVDDDVYISDSLGKASTSDRSQLESMAKDTLEALRKARAEGSMSSKPMAKPVDGSSSSYSSEGKEKKKTSDLSEDDMAEFLAGNDSALFS